MSSFFSGIDKIFFGQKWLSPPPRRKTGQYSYTLLSFLLVGHVGSSTCAKLISGTVLCGRV